MKIAIVHKEENGLPLANTKWIYYSKIRENSDETQRVRFCDKFQLITRRIIIINAQY